MKRDDFLSWDEYFMGIALLSAQRSKDPGTQVGACIVNNENRILSMGYNGMPYTKMDNDNIYPWDREGDALSTKYLFVCHAEFNAILNYSGGSMRDSILYTTLFPCNECTKAIVQKGIAEIVYLSDKYADSESVMASKLMLDAAGVNYRLYKPKNRTISLPL